LTTQPVGSPHVLMMVGNDVTADTRVRKMAVSLAHDGFRVTVLGMSTTGVRTEGDLGAARIVRVPVLFALRNRARALKARSVQQRVRLAYATKDEYVAARRRAKVAEREVAAHAGRLRKRLESRDEPMSDVERVLALLHFKVRRAALRPRRRVVDARAALYRRQLEKAGAGSSTKRGLAARPKVPVPVSWRRLLPEIEDYELAFGPVIDELAPDLIHAHDVHMIGLAERAVARARLKGRNVKWVYDAHEYVPGLARYSGRLLDAYSDLEAEYIRSADRVITVSEPIAEKLQEAFDLPRRPAVVMNIPVVGPVDARDAPSVRVAAGVEEGVPLLVYSGGMDRTRGVHTLVRALPLLPDVHVALVAKGTSNYIKSLEALAEESRCRDRLHVVPFVAPDQVVAYLSSATAGVHTLTHYGNHEVALPNKFFEYLHARLPIAVSDVRAMAELTAELGVGEVFTAEDPESLAQAVSKILDDRDRYVRPLIAHPEILNNFSWARQQEKLTQVYGELVEALGLDLGTVMDGAVVSLAERPSEPPKRRLGIGPANMAGQAWAWGRALEEAVPQVSVEVFSLKKNSPLVFPTDRSIPAASWKSLDWQLGQVRHVLDQYTHVLLEAGQGAFGTLNGGLFFGDLPALEKAGIHTGLIFHGSELRNPREHRKLEAASPFADPQAEASVKQQEVVDRIMPHVRAFGGPVFVSTNDLLDHVPHAVWLPVVVDLARWTPGDEPLTRPRPVVLHVPSNGALKGSSAVDLVAQELDAEGLIEYRRLSSVPVDEMPAVVREADIVLDQFAIGDYGVLACEAMASGRVVVGHVADRVRHRIPSQLPIIEATSEDLRSVMRSICADRDRARAAAMQGVLYVTAFHSGSYSARVLLDFLDITLD
jgi:glycosyltransferase involved in cell wall biosynthesis